MHKLADPAEVDTLGIAMYASLMPADRKSLDDTFIGPTGGCCMLTRALIERLKAVSGYCFDPRFFCYCEDTDMVLRAVLLGYRPIYLDQLVALHEGQASSGGGQIVKGLLHAESIDFTPADHEVLGPGPSIPVWMYNPTDAQGRIDRTCPVCGQARGLLLFGMRAARLKSTPFNA